MAVNIQLFLDKLVLWSTNRHIGPSYTQYTHAIADQVYLHQSILHDMLDVDRTFTTQHKTTHVCRSAVLVTMIHVLCSRNT